MPSAGRKEVTSAVARKWRDLEQESKNQWNDLAQVTGTFHVGDCGFTFV